jgi:hypothetical protein
MFKTKTSVLVATGCFLGTLEEFEAEVEKKQEGDQHRETYESFFGALKAFATRNK